MKNTIMIILASLMLSPFSFADTPMAVCPNLSSGLLDGWTWQNKPLAFDNITFKGVVYSSVNGKKVTCIYNTPKGPVSLFRIGEPEYNAGNWSESEVNNNPTGNSCASSSKFCTCWQVNTPGNCPITFAGIKKP